MYIYIYIYITLSLSLSPSFSVGCGRRVLHAEADCNRPRQGRLWMKLPELCVKGLPS